MRAQHGIRNPLLMFATTAICQCRDWVVANGRCFGPNGISDFILELRDFCRAAWREGLSGSIVVLPAIAADGKFIGRVARQFVVFLPLHISC